MSSKPAVRSRPWVALLYTVLALAPSAGCAPRFLAHNFARDYQAQTRVVALAPMANLTTSPEGASAGQVLRQAIFEEMIERRDRYTVTIQDIGETDRRLRDAGVSDSAAARLPAPEFCKLVGADAVMTGAVTRFVKKGVAGQVASAVLGGSTVGSEIRADVAVYDGSDGRMTFQHNIKKAGGFLSSPHGLRESVGVTVADKFPYKQKRSS